MSSDSPPDFEKPWEMADVVLQTEDSDGKELHANKSVLAESSPYFRALFFQDFKEKNESVVTVRCRFNTMKEILKIIHRVDLDYSSKGLKLYEAPMLVDFFRVADLYDFPTIRKDVLGAAAELNLRDIVMEILEIQTASDVSQFLYLYPGYCFSKKEFLTLYEKITGKPLSKPTNASPPARRLNLEEITVGIQTPRIDLTKPWRLADVAISSENWQGRILYAHKRLIDFVSRQFRTLSFAPIEGSSIMATTVDVDYTTMKEILYLIHKTDFNRGPERVLHPALLHSMYQAASEDELDIPMVRNWCVPELLKQRSIDSWEAVLNLNAMPEWFSRSCGNWREVIFREDEHLSYRKGDTVVAITPCQDEPLFRSDLVLELVDIL